MAFLADLGYFLNRFTDGQPRAHRQLMQNDALSRQVFRKRPDGQFAGPLPAHCSIRLDGQQRDHPVPGSRMGITLEPKIHHELTLLYRDFDNSLGFADIDTDYFCVRSNQFRNITLLAQRNEAVWFLSLSQRILFMLIHSIFSHCFSFPLIILKRPVG
ncbi:hypothetical protein SDC9_154249 [bioreactor metagenome]|uniref:Uncharacterized protein n=1 Tax=bioreactor metagenome TaxID=1076179 RepID=A0A645F0G8_9ZZZZ